VSLQARLADGNRQRHEVAGFGRQALASRQNLNALVQVLDEALMISSDISFSLSTAAPTREAAPPNLLNVSLGNDSGGTTAFDTEESTSANHGSLQGAGSKGTIGAKSESANREP
jgi:hypothetical protein